MEDHEPNPFADRDAPSKQRSTSDISDTLNPYASPSTMSDAANAEDTTTSSRRRGLPWEEEGPSVTSFKNTVVTILTSTRHAFKVMRLTGGYVSPLIFSTIGTMIGLLAAAAIQIVTSIAEENGRAEFILAFQKDIRDHLQVVGILVAIGFLIPLLSTFCYGGVFHLFLRLFRGSRQPFQTTARVCAFAQGALGMVAMLPIPNARMIFGLVALVIWIIGVKYAHDTSIGKVIAAVVVPTFLLIGLVGFVYTYGTAWQ